MVLINAVITTADVNECTIEALIGVIPMQHSATLTGVTPALVTLDTQAVDVLAQVSTFLLLFYFVP